MYAIEQTRFGGPEELRRTEIPDVEAAPGFVRIRVEAAGVHLIDAQVRSGVAEALPFSLPELPMVPGREVAGTIDRLGEGVDPSWAGRRVVTHLGMAFGGYAELAVREVEALHAIPEGVSPEVAVAMIGTGRTTVGILRRAAIETDEVVLVLAAGGGIGAIAVQALAARGVTVVGVAGGPEKTARVAALAPGVVAVDYLDPDWPSRVRQRLSGRDINVVLDGVGGDVGRAAFDLLGFGGRIVLFGWSAGDVTPVSVADLYARNATAMVALGSSIIPKRGGIRALETEALRLVEDGVVRPLTTAFPLGRAADAHAALQSRATVGKVVLIP
ncbi:zinc-binding dehydrogenase [Stackebrandtia soli]|uniref:zinc-binding dehydrogenase n=1 Tax=Stackebrandtia soli TaxID=1892856 RepID=UPI0039EAF731